MNLAAKILENKQEDQVATQIPLRGEIESPDIDILTTIVNLMRNAFVAAFSRSLEGSITLRDVASDVRCLSGEPPAEEQPDGEQSRSERLEPRPASETARLHRAGEAQERAAVIEAQVREVVGEVREVVADADLEVRVQVARHDDERAAALVGQVRHLEHARLDEPFPVLLEAEVRADDEEVGRVVEELGVVAAQAQLAAAMRVLAADRPTSA